MGVAVDHTYWQSTRVTELFGCAQVVLCCGA